MSLARSAGKTRCRDASPLPLPCPCLLQRQTLPAAKPGTASFPSKAWVPFSLVLFCFLPQ